MCCSATLAMEMSSTSMKAASPTVGATSQRRAAAGAGGEATRAASRLDMLGRIPGCVT